MKRPKLSDYNFGLLENIKTLAQFVSDWNQYSNLLKLRIKELENQVKELKK